MDRPHLRLVDSPSQGSTPPAPAPASAPSAALAPLPAESDLATAILAADVSRPRVAFRLAWTARTLIGAALETRRAAASAAPHLHPRGATPGERSAESAEVVARAHLAEAVAGRTREAELRQIALRAVEEVASARRIAQEAGVESDEALSVHLREAASHLAEAHEPARDAGGSTALVRVGDAPGATVAAAPRGRGLGDLLAALFGGVLIGLLAARIFGRAPIVLPTRQV